MQPSDDNELTDQELDAILPAWTIPEAPARLRVSIFPEVPMPWWRRLWSASLRIPLPVACCLAILFALVVWRRATPRTIYRDRVMAAFPVAGAAGELHPVNEFQPRIIRSGNVQN